MAAVIAHLPAGRQRGGNRVGRPQRELQVVQHAFGAHLWRQPRCALLGQLLAIPLQAHAGLAHRLHGQPHLLRIGLQQRVQITLVAAEAEVQLLLQGKRRRQAGRCQPQRRQLDQRPRHAAGTGGQQQAQQDRREAGNQALHSSSSTRMRRPLSSATYGLLVSQA
ncbi:hypothetical protein D3C72_1572910 [compost metagenome]